MVLIVVVIGIFVLAGLFIVVIAAYKIDADSFEFTTTIAKVASISIKITSRARRRLKRRDLRGKRRTRLGALR